MSQSFKLYRLQQIDSQIDRVKARLREIDLALKEDSALRQAQGQIQSVEKTVQEAAKTLRHTEADVQAQRIKIEQTEAALYGGKVRNPKELQDLQNESIALKRYLSVLEDRQLDAMLILEQAEVDQKTALADHTTAQTETNERNTNLLKERSILLMDLERQQEERNAAASNIPEVDLQTYEQLRKQRNGVAVAKVVDKTCAACGSTLSAALLSAAHNPNQLTRCASCGRILYAG